MTRLSRHHRAMLSGFALSLVIHLAALFGIGKAPISHLLASLSGIAPVAPVPPPTEDPFTLGIAESEAVTVNWIGFEAPTEHQAPQAETEQPALALNPGPPSPVPPEPGVQANPAPPEAPIPPPQEPQATPGAEAQTQLDALFAELRPILDRLAAAAAKALADASNPATQPESGDPGEPSDRDSDPTAFVGTIDIVPGHPVARKGLEIKTIRPKWVNLTRMTTRPDNPTVIIKFRRSGTVAEADFAPGLNTGYASVDGPLLDAIYSWRASGEALQRLPPDDPAATLQVRIRVIMR